MGRDQNLKATPLVSVKKTIKCLRIFTNMMLNLNKSGRCRFKFTESSWRHMHQISDAVGLNQHCRFSRSFENYSAQ